MVGSKEQKVDSKNNETNLENSEANNINNHNNDTNVYVDDNGNVFSIENDNLKDNSFSGYAIVLGVFVFSGVLIIICSNSSRRAKEAEVGARLTRAGGDIDYANRLMKELIEEYPFHYKNNRRF